MIVGSLVGSLVGAPDGSLVGSLVGAPDGSLVGSLHSSPMHGKPDVSAFELDPEPEPDCPPDPPVLADLPLHIHSEDKQ